MSGCRTQFTQAGVNKFKGYPDDKVAERMIKSGRDGFIGWLGSGGSVMQWHPGHNLGFAYTCTNFAWWDLPNSKARQLQRETVKCVVSLKERGLGDVETKLLLPQIPLAMS